MKEIASVFSALLAFVGVHASAHTDIIASSTPQVIITSTSTAITGTSMTTPKHVIKKHVVAPKKKKIVKKAVKKTFLMVNAPLIDPNNPPSSSR